MTTIKYAVNEHVHSGRISPPPPACSLHAGGGGDVRQSNVGIGMSACIQPACRSQNTPSVKCNVNPTIVILKQRDPGRIAEIQWFLPWSPCYHSTEFFSDDAVDVMRKRGPSRWPMSVRLSVCHTRRVGQ